MAIDLAPGQTIRRTELHERYGGRRQGGISPSRASDNVFVITAPDRGPEYGYIYDGQGEDGYYHYTGEGQFGDQQMAQGNRAIRDHVAEGRELHLFEAHGTELTHLGQYRYHDLWRERQDRNKHDRVLGFGRILPRLRETVGEHLSGRGLRRERVLAAAVRLIDLGFFRPGDL